MEEKEIIFTSHQNKFFKINTFSVGPTYFKITSGKDDLDGSVLFWIFDIEHHLDIKYSLPIDEANYFAKSIIEITEATCIWGEELSEKGRYNTQCGKSWIDLEMNDECEHCPHCGKEIEYVKRNGEA